MQCRLRRPQLWTLRFWIFSSDLEAVRDSGELEFGVARFQNREKTILH